MTLFLLGCAGVWAFCHRPYVVCPLTYELSPGGGVLRWSASLRRAGLFKQRWHEPLFRLWIFFQEDPRRPLRFGEYALSMGMSLDAVYRQAVEGRVILHAFTVIEGWCFADVMRALIQMPEIADASSAWNDFCLREGRSFINAEGLFFPETYYFPKNLSAGALLQKAHHLMQERLSILWNTRDPKLPYRSAEEPWIIASLLEKETACPGERERVAGVILRRLHIGMPLQLDPTLCYARPEGCLGSPLTRSDLRLDHPYNTYLHRGLPPTPIAYPSMNSLKAAFHPKIDEDVLYFVADPDHPGCHIFSSDLKTHQKNVARYRAFQARKPSSQVVVPIVP